MKGSPSAAFRTEQRADKRSPTDGKSKSKSGLDPHLLPITHQKEYSSRCPLRSVGLHKLKGDRKGRWAMTVNARWRICFKFDKGDAYEVEVVDYHKG